ncbi:MAG: hypothetical protein KGI54_08955 [Pseudomonadota bacterium]|nr:hypothetical protein [Pseudomonadota bacterium]
MANGRRIANTVTFPAPVGGWNARDSLAAMKKEDAVILDNLVPKTTEVVLRSGSVDHVTGISGTVETLAVYAKANGTYSMFAAAGTSIYDVTNAGTVGAAVQTGLSNARWQTVNFATAGGKFLYMVNGADAARYWDGTTWTNAAITGVSSSSLISVNTYQRRLWFVEKDSMRVWYLPVVSIAGVAQSFDLSSLFGQGGYLVAMATITSDSGTGMDDFAVFLSSEGEIAVYRGIDPASAATWYLVGVYSVGSPVGRRCFTSYGADSLIISKDGVLPMSKALATARTNTSISITDKIQQAMSEATSTYGDQFGWELTVFPEENLVILNVPVPNGSQQFVMYALNGSWCRFTGWNAKTFTRMGTNLYAGLSGKVMKVYAGQTDNGAQINGEALASFQYHGGMASKRYTMARPIISSTAGATILLGLNLDFDQSPPTGSIAASNGTAGVWGTGVWGTFTWGGDFVINKNWQTVGGVGYCAAIHMKISALNSKVKWQSCDYIFEKGYGL